MTTTDFMTGFIMVVMGVILGKCLLEATEDYRAVKKIREDYRKEQQRKKDWKKLTQKEADYE
jgi:hypothetical protein